LHLLPGQARRQRGAFALHDGAQPGWVVQRAHVQENFVPGGRRGVERAFHHRLLAVAGERDLQVASFRLREQLQVHNVDARRQAVQQRTYQHRGGDRWGGVRADAGVEPCQRGFGLGVARIIYVQGFGAGRNRPRE
jgi:hypothetical protein